MSTWRRFELGGLLGSFFEIAVDGAQLRLKIGSGARKAREQVRPQASQEAARAELERLVAAHLAKGYVEVPWLGDGSAATLASDLATRIAQREREERERADREAQAAAEAHAAELERRRGVVSIATNPELEAQCEASPDDPAPWSVYADWLVEHGDPRGLVASHLLRGANATAAELLALHYQTLCTTDAKCAFDFRHGFVHAIEVANPVERGEHLVLADLVGTLLNAPIGRFIDEVRTGLAAFGSDNTWEPTLAAILRSPRSDHLRTLRFDAFDYDECMMHWVQIGDLSALRELPALEALHVRGSTVTWGNLALPAVRRFVRETCNMTRAELAQICGAPWPELEHLELWFGSRQYGVDVELDDFRALFDGDAFPALTHLGLVNCDLLDDLIPRLASSALSPRLHSLDLRMGTLAHDGAHVLARNAAAFRHLASLELDDNLLEPDDARRITEVLDNVVIGRQREFNEDDDAYRYPAEYE